MFATILIGLLILIGVLFILLAPSVKFDRGTSYEWTLSRLWGLIPIGIALVVLAFSTTYIIGAKTAGVPVAFGKADVENPKGPGLGVKAPWESIVKISTVRQTDIYNNSEKDDDDTTRYHGAIGVRLGNNNPAKGYVSLAWAPNPDAVGNIYTDFRGDDPTEKLYASFVQVLFKKSVYVGYGTYNPTALMAQVAKSDDPIQAVAETNLAPDLDLVSDAIEEDFKARVIEASAGGPPLILVYSVEASDIDLGADTEASIKQFQVEINKTINSKQAIQTAQNLADANEKIAASISKEPGVLTSRCLDLIADGWMPPAAFSCFGPSSADPVVPVG